MDSRKICQQVVSIFWLISSIFPIVPYGYSSNEFVRFVKRDNQREMNALFVRPSILENYLNPKKGQEAMERKAEEIILHGAAAGCVREHIKVKKIYFIFVVSNYEVIYQYI